MDSTERPTSNLVMEEESQASDTQNGNKNASVEQLASGFLDLYEKDLIRVEGSLHEILVKQGKMAEDLHELNNNYSGASLDGAQTLFDTVRIYKDKLHSIKKQMTGIHQRSKTLKKRMQILHDFCVKEHDERKIKQMQEEALIAKSSSK